MSVDIEWTAELDTEQLTAVQHGTGPLLVVAGPGSGKTRVLTYRVAYLIAEQGVAPDRILAVTFTNKAAEEMRERLEGLLGHAMAMEITVCTVHAAALRLLREFTQEAGLRPHFVVFDETAQDDVITMALDRLGWSRYSTAQDLSDLRLFLSQRKAHGLGFEFTGQYGESGARAAAMFELAQVYQKLLAEFNALDFDDLIIRAALLLWEHEEVRNKVQRRFAHLLVDEFHDLNPAQYELLKLLCPPRGNFAAVVDENQSIYRWRGAEPGLVKRFQHDYHPDLVELRRNYRSTPHILAAAKAILDQKTPALTPPLRTTHRAGDKVQHLFFAKLSDEQAWLQQEIHKLLDQGRSPGDLAILYRTHRLGDPIHAALQAAHIPVRRVQRERFFDRPGAREVLRYLQLLQAFTDPLVKGAINFPRVIADELTMIQLNELAARAGLSVAELCRRLDDFPEVSPLTRAAVRDFIHLVEEELQAGAPGEIEELLERLFGALERRRSPYREEEMETLRGFAAFLNLSSEVRQWRAAIDAGQPVSILSAPTLDALCGAVILEHALRHYLRLSPVLQLAGSESSVALPGFVLALETPLPAAANGLALTSRTVGSLRYAVSTVAWRLAQGLLVSYETLDQVRFVVYDVETTGRDPAQEDIIEIAALTVDRGIEVGQPFASLVRPSRPISPEATEVHGLTWADVEGAPPIEVVLPQFLRYVGDAILVGHNAVRFDNVLVNRAMKRFLGGRRLINPTLDTLEMARRLYPRSSHSLKALAERFGLVEPIHRALADACQERDLLFRLLAENRWQKELHALTEMLPLVALGMWAAGVPLADENQALLFAAARALPRHEEPPGVHRLMSLLPDEAWWEASRRLAQLASTPIPQRLDDIHWNELRQGWLRQAATFTELVGGDLEAFLGYASLVSAEDELPGEEQPDQVTLMTLHNAKGKEFPVVFIIGLEEGHLPYFRSLENPDDLAEERRVLYVGMTRAKERLYLISTREREEGWFRIASSFTQALPPAHVERVYYLASVEGE